MRSYRCDFYFRYFFYWWGNIAILTLLINQIFLLRAFYLFRAAIYVRKKIMDETEKRVNKKSADTRKIRLPQRCRKQLIYHPKLNMENNSQQNLHTPKGYLDFCLSSLAAFLSLRLASLSFFFWGWGFVRSCSLVSPFLPMSLTPDKMNVVFGFLKLFVGV